jgi:hypothetical protein
MGENKPKRVRGKSLSVMLVVALKDAEQLMKEKNPSEASMRLARIRITTLNMRLKRKELAATRKFLAEIAKLKDTVVALQAENVQLKNDLAARESKSTTRTDIEDAQIALAKYEREKHERERQAERHAGGAQ